MNKNVKNMILSSEERTKVEFERLVENCRNYGIKLDSNILESYNLVTLIFQIK